MRPCPQNSADRHPPGSAPAKNSLAGELDDLVRELERLAGSAVENPSALSASLRDLASRLRQAAGAVAALESGAPEIVSSLQRVNAALSAANARAAELIVEIEHKNASIETLNKKLASANATAAELVAELDIQRSELAKANASLRLANEEKAHLLGLLAHDLRSGVGAISSLADLLLGDESPADEEKREYLSLIQGQSRQLLELLSSLLGMSRLEHGRLEIHPRAEDLCRLVRDAVAFHRPLAALKNQQIFDELPPGPVPAYCDPAYIRQTLDNIISNAVKYSFPGGRIDIICKSEPPFAVVSVLDSGPGLAPGDFSKIFTPFQKLSAKPTGGEPSHGLGLTIAKKVIETHGGELTVENRSDQKGAVFRFTLPMTPPR